MNETCGFTLSRKLHDSDLYKSGALHKKHAVEILAMAMGTI
jgi:hypothetical protein